MSSKGLESKVNKIKEQWFEVETQTDSYRVLGDLIDLVKEVIDASFPEIHV